MERETNATAAAAAVAAAAAHPVHGHVTVVNWVKVETCILFTSSMCEVHAYFLTFLREMSRNMKMSCTFPSFAVATAVVTVWQSLGSFQGGRRSTCALHLFSTA